MNQKTAFLGIFAAVAIILGYVEALVPIPFPVPGIKLGLANLCVLYILAKYSIKEAALISIVRIIVIGYLFGNLFGIIYGLAGAALSLTVMSLLRKYSGLSLIGISVAGGVSHNIGQLIVAACVVENTVVFFYFPFLLVAGVVAGVLIGTLTQELAKRIH
ncbi:MAG: Gx transporter family protein [Blautia sp.]|nr:Gx transporter family protein [Blautia sp.]